MNIFDAKNIIINGKRKNFPCDETTDAKISVFIYRFVAVHSRLRMPKFFDVVGTIVSYDNNNCIARYLIVLNENSAYFGGLTKFHVYATSKTNLI